MTHLAADLPVYVDKAEHGKGWIGHLVTRYHVQAWVKANAPKLASYGKDLANPVLSVGKGAITLLVALLTDLRPGRAAADGGPEAPPGTA